MPPCAQRRSASPRWRRPRTSTSATAWCGSSPWGPTPGPGRTLLEGNSDAIQLVGLDLASGRAAGIGIPRDSWLEIPGHRAGPDQPGHVAGRCTDLTAEVVADLVGIQPNYVFVAGFDGFTGHGRHHRRGRRAVGPRRSGTTSSTSTYRKGRNDFDGTEALDYTRTRQLPASDFARSANQQADRCSGSSSGLRAHEDEEGFMERGALAALAGLDTDLGADRALPPGPGGHPDPTRTASRPACSTGDTGDDLGWCAAWCSSTRRGCAADRSGRPRGPAVRRRVLLTGVHSSPASRTR